jgi:ABC-type molybdenum transport system ATPase subunit/photorepair protein PhrA
MGKPPLLELSGARVLRDGREILSIDSFTIRSGEHLAVLGPNGAGKSTLIGLLTKDVHPVFSEPYPLRFMGEPRYELAEARKLLGVVSSSWQEVVDVHLSVAEIVLGGRFAALGVPGHAHPSRQDREAAASALEELGIAHLAERDMTTLSTGEARRALIARALVHDPKVLVLDEPCAGLDPAAAWRLRETVRELASQGRSLVLVTHHIEDVVRQIDRVVLMDAGRIVADGDKAELLSGESLSRLFGVKVDVEEREGEYRLW